MCDNLQISNENEENRTYRKKCQPKVKEKIIKQLLKVPKKSIQY